jgi:hypothetical protein
MVSWVDQLDFHFAIFILGWSAVSMFLVCSMSDLFYFLVFRVFVIFRLYHFMKEWLLESPILLFLLWVYFSYFSLCIAIVFGWGTFSESGIFTLDSPKVHPRWTWGARVKRDFFILCGITLYRIIFSISLYRMLLIEMLLMGDLFYFLMFRVLIFYLLQDPKVGNFL